MNKDERKLAHLLNIAAGRFAAIQGPIWSSYDSGTELARFVWECQSKITEGTIESAQARELWGIFAPTCDWDDVVGDITLGEAIFTLLNKLYGPGTEKSA